MVHPTATTLIQCDVQTDIKGKCSDFVDGGNGCLYGIPCSAHRVLQYNIEEKRLKEIGPNLGASEGKYCKGIRADNGSIYCLPYNAEYLLKIIPGEGKDAEVKVLEDGFQPEYRYRWMAGALADNGCLYYLPYGNGATRILKVDTNNGDNFSLVGEGYIGSCYRIGVFGHDGCIYGISNRRIIKYNPADNTELYVNKGLNNFYSFVGGVLAHDSNIYSANKYGQILKIDSANNDWTIIGDRIFNDRYCSGWGRPVLGADKCIYFPPSGHNQVLKFNPSTQHLSLIGGSYGIERNKWVCAVLASDGFVYCLPDAADDILKIDSRHINEKILELIMNISMHKNSVN